MVSIFGSDFAKAADVLKITTTILGKHSSYKSITK